MKWDFGKLSNGHVLPLLVFWFLLLILIAGISGCTLPSGGYYSRMEEKFENILYVAKKNEANTYSTAKNTGDTESKKELEVARETIPVPLKAPEDKNPGDWIEILLYLLLGSQGLDYLVRGGSHLRKMKPPERT